MTFKQIEKLFIFLILGVAVLIMGSIATYIIYYNKLANEPNPLERSTIVICMIISTVLAVIATVWTALAYTRTSR